MKKKRIILSALYTIFLVYCSGTEKTSNQKQVSFVTKDSIQEFVPNGQEGFLVGQGGFIAIGEMKPLDTS